MAALRYEWNITTMKNFLNSWIRGSTNLKLSNMLDHAKSEVHKGAITGMRADGARESLQYKYTFGLLLVYNRSSYPSPVETEI